MKIISLFLSREATSVIIMMFPLTLAGIIAILIPWKGQNWNRIARTKLVIYGKYVHFGAFTVFARGRLSTTIACIFLLLFGLLLYSLIGNKWGPTEFNYKSFCCINIPLAEPLRIHVCLYFPFPFHLSFLFPRLTI